MEMAQGGLTDNDEVDTEDVVEMAKACLADFPKPTSLDALNTIIFLLQQSLARLPSAHPIRSAALTTLIDALCARFHLSNNISDLNTLISSLQVETDWKKLSILWRICCLLAARFNFAGDILDLQTAFYWFRDANIEGTETSRGVFKIAQARRVANELCGQFLESRNMANMANAIMLYREGMAKLPASSGNYTAAVSNLATALYVRFEQGRQQTDLDEAVSLQREAAELQLPHHPDRSFELYNLACSQWTRFQHGGQQTDYDEAISLHKQTLELRPPSHSDRLASHY